MAQTPRDAAIAMLSGQPPSGLVPTFELEFQLTEAFFGRPYYTGGDWAGLRGAARERQIASLAEDYAVMFEDLGYCILMETRTPDDEARLAVIRRVRELVGERYLFLCHGDATQAIPNGNVMMDYVVRLYEEPDEVKRENDRRVDAMLERGRRLLDGGMDGFALCSDYCFNTGPFLSPAMFGEFVTPWLTRLVQGYRAMGAWVIKHTDGNINPILDDLIAGEPHALHSLDPQGDVDLAEIKRRIGDRICLIGGVNCGLLQTGTDAEVEADVRRVLRDGMPGGRYILSTSNVAFQGMPPERYRKLLALRMEFGWYPPAPGGA